MLYLSLSTLLLIFVEILVEVPPAAGPIFSYKLSKGGVSLKKLRRLIIFYKFPCKTKPTQISISCLKINTTLWTSLDGDSWAFWTQNWLSHISLGTYNWSYCNFFFIQYICTYDKLIFQFIDLSTVLYNVTLSRYNLIYLYYSFSK